MSLGTVHEPDEASPVDHHHQEGNERQLRFSSLMMGEEYEFKRSDKTTTTEIKEAVNSAPLEISRAFCNARYPDMLPRDVLEIEAAGFHYRGWWCPGCEWYYNYPTTMCSHNDWEQLPPRKREEVD